MSWGVRANAALIHTAGWRGAGSSGTRAAMALELPPAVDTLGLPPAVDTCKAPPLNSHSSLRFLEETSALTMCPCAMAGEWMAGSVVAAMHSLVNS